MQTPIRIGTRESQLAVWQATQVKELLAREGTAAELVFIKSEGDIDLKTPLYEMGVQGVFTRSLDAALLSGRIDVAVHSMKDVPTQLPEGLQQAAVLKRGPVYDLLVYNNDPALFRQKDYIAHIATSSIRRKAQWLHKYPNHQVHNLRGNVNTRLKKLKEERWDAAIFAQAGLERIHLRPENSVLLDWMLPAPAQGAIMVVCRSVDETAFHVCQPLNDVTTAFCVKTEREFLRVLLGGCSTPISALAEIENEELYFRGSILSLDGSRKVEIEKILPVDKAAGLGKTAAEELLERGGKAIADGIREAGKSPATGK
ncbi:hydroxymethylbilane synthase [Flavitalea sp. BT771]|uniref:hydroxymethylbilane synthase n=1 Tax=Flavitalea sp. BT771 TaxID=3063329 RepID=UPI0026E2E13E|nr:hydroxymethylbilane synthase [Flavitalea sp. BT771]MDO6433804.1 hydroxymethylbilane synthase [Flavitalea sp. BT771]MDV6222291.1 hydroxymethylbilane synthase [Flavitalea sp. BT771]